MSNPNATLIETMKTMTFGVELETIGAPRAKIAAAIAAVVNGTVEGDGYRDRYTVRMPDGRKWSIIRDGSIEHVAYSGEVVSPILVWSDMELLQDVARAVRKCGATVDEKCGLHVHVGAALFDGAALGRLAKLCTQQEALMYKALQVTESRVRFCRPADESFIARVVAERPTSREAILAAWYGSASAAAYARTDHYHTTRYRGLNLHAIQFHGTAEFRYFDGTLHAGKIKTYVHLCLAIMAKALTSKGALARKRTFDPSTAKYDVRVFLLRIGLIGDEFATARHHLLDHLAGSASRSGKGKARKVIGCANDPSLDTDVEVAS